MRTLNPPGPSSSSGRSPDPLGRRPRPGLLCRSASPPHPRSPRLGVFSPDAGSDVQLSGGISDPPPALPEHSGLPCPPTATCRSVAPCPQGPAGRGCLTCPCKDSRTPRPRAWACASGVLAFTTSAQPTPRGVGVVTGSVQDPRTAIPDSQPQSQTPRRWVP